MKDDNKSVSAIPHIRCGLCRKYTLQIGLSAHASHFRSVCGVSLRFCDDVCGHFVAGTLFPYPYVNHDTYPSCAWEIAWIHKMTSWRFSLGKMRHSWTTAIIGDDWTTSTYTMKQQITNNNNNNIFAALTNYIYCYLFTQSHLILERQFDTEPSVERIFEQYFYWLCLVMLSMPVHANSSGWCIHIIRDSLVNEKQIEIEIPNPDVPLNAIRAMSTWIKWNNVCIVRANKMYLYI